MHVLKILIFMNTVILCRKYLPDGVFQDGCQVTWRAINVLMSWLFKSCPVKTTNCVKCILAFSIVKNAKNSIFSSVSDGESKFIFDLNYVIETILTHHFLEFNTSCYIENKAQWEFPRWPQNKLTCKCLKNVISKMSYFDTFFIKEILGYSRVVQLKQSVALCVYIRN